MEKGIRQVPTNRDESYDEDDYYVDLTTEAIKPLWINVGYHTRGKNYSINNPEADNFGRADEGPRFTFTGAYRMNPKMVWTMYYSRDVTDSSVPSRSFNTSFMMLTVSYGL